ncbi:hypothetical protein OVA13_05765 [Pseudoxanthomonas sp. SL93]|uniref:hypothetical protein n=1 Tax=Pseudoxanthomonas sp. SL93 TaxID=2995142 RepID=UPI00227090B8|nr:hypothetical protein [Pseudoxanthomonas sp. SL93]WAC64281.1 hypothetical protein OVA13_05765 [Pseudoxanthomonas sp. SL93]
MGAGRQTAVGVYGYHRHVSTDHIASFADDDLPLVRRGFPWPIRVGCVLAGAFAVVMPLWELGRGLWPLNIASPVFAIIVGGAGYVGVQFIRAGLSGWGDEWTYPPHTVLVQRRAWGRLTTTRLTRTNVAAVEVRRSEDSDHDDAPWQVVIVPRPMFSGLAAAAGAGGVFDAGCYGSRDYAERVRRALHGHLGL